LKSYNNCLQRTNLTRKEAADHLGAKFPRIFKILGKFVFEEKNLIIKKGTDSLGAMPEKFLYLTKIDSQERI
jgi:hypothetical protein